MGICFSRSKDVYEPRTPSRRTYDRAPRHHDDNRVKMVKVEGMNNKIATLNHSY